MRTLAVIAGAAVLSGCAATYQAPTSGSTATLMVGQAGEEGGSQFSVYKDRLCAPHPAGQRYYTTAGTFGAQTQKIPAGQEFVLTGTWGKTGLGVAYRCSATASFVPEEGRVYVATIAADMKTSRCTLGIEEQAAGANRPVASYRKNADLCFAGENTGPINNGRFNNIVGGGTTVVR
jgi:hypothetical protein